MSDNSGLDAQFKRAVDFVQSLPSDGPLQLSINEKLVFYSLFKQATEGENKTKKPSMLNVVAKTKWDAWKKLGKMTSQQAKQNYLNEFRKIGKKMNNEEGRSILKELDDLKTVSAKGASAGQNPNSKVIIYGNYLSQPSRALVWFCLLSKIPFEFKTVDLGKGEHKSEEFLKINPLGKVPAVSVDGINIFESHTILKFLSNRFNVEDHFYPRDEVKRLRIEEYLDWHHLGLRKACAGFFFATVLGPSLGLKYTEQELNNLQKEIHIAFKTMDTFWLNNNATYLNGSQISIADISAYCEIYQLAAIGYDWSKYKNLDKFMKHMSSLPHANEINVVVHKLAQKRNLPSKL